MATYRSRNLELSIANARRTSFRDTSIDEAKHRSLNVTEHTLRLEAIR